MDSASSSPPAGKTSVDIDSASSSPVRVLSTFDKSLPHIDAGSSLRKPLSVWPGMHQRPPGGPLEQLLDHSKEGPPRRELLARTPSQSRTTVVYNLSSDYILREQYRDPWNEVRIGKLLEDLDALAGTIAVKHCSDEDSTTKPLLLVTAAVDRVVLKKQLHVDKDIKMQGAVIYVGRSSIEIQIEVDQPQKDIYDSPNSIALTANFTFVARDSKSGKPVPVNPLLPETEEEKLFFEQGKERKRRREERKRDRENDRHSLHGDVKRLRHLLAGHGGRVFCDLHTLVYGSSILIRDTSLENSLICHPQQKNLFGDFLMNLAFELAFSTVYAFVGQMAIFLEVDRVNFLKPVDVGDFLRFKSCVLYTQLDNPEKPLINIEVVAHVMRPELQTSEISNTFYFASTVNPEALKNGLRIRKVVPATEEEARRVLQRMEAEEVFV